MLFTDEGPTEQLEGITFPFDLRDLDKARIALIERASWRKIEYVAKTGETSFWIAHPKVKPAEALEAISSTWAKFESPDDTAEITEWVLSAPFFTPQNRQRKMTLTKTPEPEEGYNDDDTLDITKVASLQQLGSLVEPARKKQEEELPQNVQFIGRMENKPKRK